MGWVAILGLGVCRSWSVACEVWPRGAATGLIERNAHMDTSAARKRALVKRARTNSTVQRLDDLVAEVASVQEGIEKEDQRVQALVEEARARRTDLEAGLVGLVREMSQLGLTASGIAGMTGLDMAKVRALLKAPVEARASSKVEPPPEAGLSWT